jgi:hypothetical protein
MERIIRRLLSFTRNKFAGRNSDIEKALQKTGGAIFLQRIGKNPYNPSEEGQRLFRVLMILFPKATLEVLRVELNRQFKT